MRAMRGEVKDEEMILMKKTCFFVHGINWLNLCEFCENSVCAKTHARSIYRTLSPTYTIDVHYISIK